MTVEETKLVCQAVRMLTQVIDELQWSAARIPDSDLSLKIRSTRELGRDVRGMLGSLRCTEHRNVIKSIRKIS